MEGLFLIGYFCEVKLFRQIFEFYINSSIHVSLAVLSLTFITIMEYDLNLDPKVLFFIFFGSISGYNFVKYAKVAGMHHRSLTSSLKTIQVFSFFSFAILVLLSTQLSIKTLMVYGCFSLLTFFYAVPFIWNKSLRKFGGLKIFVVALVWGGVAVIVPLVASESQITVDKWLTFLQIVVIVITLTLPFEIRDLPYDARDLKTLPQGLGVEGVKIFGYVLLLGVLGLEYFKNESNMEHSISLIFVVALIAGVLLISKTKQPKYFAPFWVESVPIVWVLIYYFIK